ncbi:MAG: hypothetical protein QW244_01240 [Candidatus Pacearchaeota archaeon]
MPILNIYFNKISANREKVIKTKKVSVTLTLKDPEESDTKLEDKKILIFPFDFEVNYEKEAKISISGYLTYLEEKERANEILKNWKKEKELAKIIYNFVLTKSNLKALLIEDQLNLPLHIPMPRIK